MNYAVQKCNLEYSTPLLSSKKAKTMRFQHSISNIVRALFISALTWLCVHTARATDPLAKLAVPGSVLVKGTTFISFDTETTGLDPKTDRVLEVAVVKFRDGQLLEQRSWLINPGIPIDPLSTDVHGITDEMVASQPRFAAIYPDFQSFIKGSVLIAHNAPFDINFINAEMGRLPDSTIIPENDIVDSLRLIRKWYPKLPSYRLSAIAETMDIPSGNFHRASDDAIALAGCFIKALQQHTHTKTTLQELFLETAGAQTFAWFPAVLQ